ncbi:MAG: TatD family deoxyribonuclease [Firmicutes bacterium]|nr:TatD family deoxyribonuclease [Bacillota bacterium]
MMIDTHCHLNFEDYNNLDDIINRMKENIIIVSGCDGRTNQDVLNLCNKYDNIYGCLGIHPESVDTATVQDLKFIEGNLNHPKIVAIGEIGLDYYWTKENKALQKEWFQSQIDLAKKYDKAIVVHSRDSIQDTYDMLKNSQVSKVDIHCFSSSLEMAEKFIKLGAKIGIGGVLTFKKSEKLKEVVKAIDLKHILLETDSPYLTPEPYRGQKNEPYNVYYVAQKIAEIKGETLENVLKETSKNAVIQFDLPIVL